MNIDVTEIVVTMIGAMAALLTAVLIPWVRAKVGAARWEQLENIVVTVVLAAEQLVATDAGKDLIAKFGGKLGYAMDRVRENMARQGLSYDVDTVRAAIEAAVLGLSE